VPVTGAELTPLSRARYESFVVRVLRRRGGAVIHAQVTHVASRRSKRFTDLQSVVGFIAGELASGTDPAEATDVEPPA
jgi:hypothetical protein